MPVETKFPGEGVRLGDGARVGKPLAPNPAPVKIFPGEGVRLGDGAHVGKPLAPNPAPVKIFPGEGVRLGDGARVGKPLPLIDKAPKPVPLAEPLQNMRVMEVKNGATVQLQLIAEDIAAPAQNAPVNQPAPQLFVGKHNKLGNNQIAKAPLQNIVLGAPFDVIKDVAADLPIKVSKNTPTRIDSPKVNELLKHFEKRDLTAKLFSIESTENSIKLKFNFKLKVMNFESNQSSGSYNEAAYNSTVSYNKINYIDSINESTVNNMAMEIDYDNEEDDKFKLRKLRRIIYSLVSHGHFDPSIPNFIVPLNMEIYFFNHHGTPFEATLFMDVLYQNFVNLVTGGTFNHEMTFDRNVVRNIEVVRPLNQCFNYRLTRFTDAEIITFIINNDYYFRINQNQRETRLVSFGLHGLHRLLPPPTCSYRDAQNFQNLQEIVEFIDRMRNNMDEYVYLFVCICRD